MIPVPPRNEAEEEQRRLQAEQRRLQAEQRRLQAEEELDWVTVASFPSEPEANAVADQLKAGSINARCPDTETIGGALLAGIRALFHVQVKAQDVEAARSILTEGGKREAGRRQGRQHYWVFGVDARSRQPREPVFLEAETVQAAWDDAINQGIEVTGLEVAAPAESASGGVPPGRRRRRRQYEFDEDQNLVIATLAFCLRVVAVVQFIASGVLLLIGLLTVLGTWPLGGSPGAPLYTAGERLARGGGYLVEAVLVVVFGLLMFGAAGSFRKIVDTQGRDITHLMFALKKLKNVYLIQVVVIGAVLLLVLALGMIAAAV